MTIEQYEGDPEAVNAPLRNKLGCHEPLCALSVSVAPGSVVLTVVATDRAHNSQVESAANSMGSADLSTLSSALFGVSHIANEKSLHQRCIYAGWTFFGGLIFGAAYLGTDGGLILPVLLHFVNNAVVAGVCLPKVADKLAEQREQFREINKRVEQEQMASAAYPFVVLKEP